MSDQPGIPAITVFPPFNPAPRREEPAPEAARGQTPPLAAEHAPEPAAEPSPAPVWDAAAAPPAPMPWDFEAPAPDSSSAANAGEMEIGDEGDDLPWLEVPTPRAPDAEGADQELHAEDTPNFMDWARTDDQPAADFADAGADAVDDDDAGVPPIGDFAMDAQPWAPEVENAADEWAPEQPAEPWKAPEHAAEDAWKAPHDDAAADAWRAPAGDEAAAPQPWDAPAQPGAAPWDAPADVDVPEPELYDLPHVPPAEPPARPWIDAEAPLFEAPADAPEPEPAWELPADTAAADTRPAWESFAADSANDAIGSEWAAPGAHVEPTPAAPPAAAAPADVSAFGEVADRLQAIAQALRSDPAGFMAGQGSDPLGLLVTGFVLGFQARRGGNG